MSPKRKIAGGGGIISTIVYPYGELLGEIGDFEERNAFEGEVPKAIPKEMVERIAMHLLKYIKLKTMYLQVTSKCNYVCPMCPFHGEGYEGKYFKDNPSLKPQNMPLEDAKMYVDKMAEYGIELVALSPQGEFFTYPYWEEISRYIKSKGLRISTTTNGSLVTKEVIEKLKDMGFDEMVFSIDSINKETYVKVRSPKEKDYQTAINAPILAAEAGIYTHVHFVQQQPNIGEKEELFTFYKKGGVNSVSCCVQRYTDNNQNRAKLPILRHEYIHGLCNAYDSGIMIDGNFITCCGMGTRYSAIKPKLDKCSLKNHSLSEVIKYNYDLLINRDEDMMNMCHHCDLYNSYSNIDCQKFIDKKYYAIRHNDNEQHFKIPSKISSLPDDVLLYMYQNNLVAKMKQDKIL